MKNLESHFINIFMRTQFSRHITTSFTRNMCRSGCVISARKKTEKTIFHLRRCYSFRCGDNALSICNEEIKVIRSTDKHESDFSEIFPSLSGCVVVALNDLTALLIFCNILPPVCGTINSSIYISIRSITRLPSIQAPFQNVHNFSHLMRYLKTL